VASCFILTADFIKSSEVSEVEAVYLLFLSSKYILSSHCLSLDGFYLLLKRHELCHLFFIYR
jgi:hypothetical protein